MELICLPSLAHLHHVYKLSVHQRFLQNDQGLLQNYAQHMRHKENTEVFRRLTHADSPCYRPATTCDCCREHSRELVSPGNLTHQMESLAKSLRFVSQESHLIESPWKTIGHTICLWCLIQASHISLAFSAILCSFFKSETDVQVWSNWPHCSRHCLQAKSSMLQMIQLKGFHDGSEKIQTRSQSEPFRFFFVISNTILKAPLRPGANTIDPDCSDHKWTALTHNHDPLGPIIDLRQGQKKGINDLHHTFWFAVN